MRLTRKVFTDLAVWMIAFGLLVGALFPLALYGVGVPESLVSRPWFVGLCMLAGLLVGATNIWLARLVVGARVGLLAQQMRLVAGHVMEIGRPGNSAACTPEACSVPVDSEDELGESGRAFNHLVLALAAAHQSDAAVRSFGSMLASHLELSEVTTNALQQMLQQTGASGGALLVVEGGKVKVAASHGLRVPEALGNSDHLRRVFQTERRVILSLPSDVSVDGLVVDFRPSEVLVEPLVYKGVPLGAVVLARATPFPGEVGSRLDLLLPGLVVAVNNAMNYQGLQQLAALDPLTGAYNRRFGTGRLREEFGRAVRLAGPLGVMMFDVDHFKAVNDTYGHLAGDRTLIQMVKTARQAIREGDVLLRYGGEEFLVILPGTSREDTRAVGERLRRMVEETSIAEGDQIIRVTISIGICSFPNPEVAGDQDMVKRADAALYAAKDSGRNRVCG